MNPFRHPLAPALGAVALVAPLAHAQLEEDAAVLNSNALTAMNAGKWEEALKLLTTAVERFDKVAPTVYGPKFGVTWYRKGICELRLKRWDDAMESFKQCYQRYPNQGDQVAAGGNNFNKLALLRWAEAAQGAENYKEAIRLYKKFLEERDANRDKFQPGAFYVGLALCHFKSGQLAEGTEHFETALKNRIRYSTPDGGIAAAFSALVEAGIEKKDQKLITAFIDRNRGDLVFDPAAMEPFAKLHLKLGSDLIGAEMPSAAWSVYQLIPGTEVMIDDIKARLRSLGNRAGIQEAYRTLEKAKLEASLAKLEAEHRGGDPNESILLAATGYLHDLQGNTRGAYACYDQLEKFHPKAKKREDNLFNLVRTAAMVGEYLAAEKHGSAFLTSFPDSRYVPDVRRLMLTSLFYGGEYQTCIEVATVMLPTLEEGSKEHEICHHVLGGSYYYTGEYDKAQELLDAHVKIYPEGAFAQAAYYFQASNNVRLQFWSKAAAQLDAFLEKYPDPEKNIYLPLALYDRATCHFSEGELDAAQAKLEDLTSRFPDSDPIDMAHNLRGNVLQDKGEAEGAEAAYKQALSIAERRSNKMVAGESLYFLIALIGEPSVAGKKNERLAEAVPYADKYWKDFAAGSPYQTRVAVAQLAAFDAAGRSKEALDRLAAVISGMASSPDTGGLEEAINSYTEVYLKSHTPDQLKDHFYDFPGVGSGDKAAQALLRTAIIGVFEQKLKSAANQDEKIKAEAMIKVLFEELKNDFNPKDLTNYILVRTGDFLRERTSAPTQALPYYEEVLGRSDMSYRFAALFGKAAVLSRGSDSEKEKAIESLRRVYQDSQDKDEKEKALYQIVETEAARNNPAGAEAVAKEYLNHEPKYTKFAPQAGMILAKSFEDRNMTEDALAAYTRVWSAYPGYIKVSAPAIKAWMQLSFRRNKPASEGSPADRQAAYEAGWNYVNNTRRIVENNKNIPQDEKAAWQEVEKLVTEFEASPDVKSVEQIKAESRK